MKPIDLVGKRFGRLVVVEYDQNSKGTGHAHWLCKCKCGKYKYVRSSHLKQKQVRSCGCLASEVSSRLLKAYTNSNAHKGKGNPSWKGDGALHSAIHTWLGKNYIKVMCVKCGSQKTLDFALRKGRNHSHNMKNYIVLCRSCHLKYDYTDERCAKVSKTLTGKKRK